MNLPKTAELKIELPYDPHMPEDHSRVRMALKMAAKNEIAAMFTPEQIAAHEPNVGQDDWKAYYLSERDRWLDKAIDLEAKAAA